MFANTLERNYGWKECGKPSYVTLHLFCTWKLRAGLKSSIYYKYGFAFVNSSFLILISSVLISGSCC